jgi:hypothetical protein
LNFFDKLCILCLCVGFALSADPQIEAVRGLIKRLLPNYVSYFELELLEKQTTDHFELESKGTKVKSHFFKNDQHFVSFVL